MELTNISISALRYDNEPFVRGLTATIVNTDGTNTVKASGAGLVAWYYPLNSGILAVTPDGTAYSSSQILPVSSIGTMYFYFSASTYDYKTTGYTLCSHTFQCINYDIFDGQTTEYTLSFDTFPNIDLTLFINYQNTNTDTLFYRLTSSTQYDANINLQSFSYTLSNNISSSYHKAWFTVNNGTTLYSSFSALSAFTRTTPRLSSVQAFLSATTPAPNNTYSNWYSNHILKKELQVSFIPNYPIANFVAWPETYFTTSTNRSEIDTSNYLTLSPGLSFYGEGHTENIRLSATPFAGHNYNWSIKNLPYNENSFIGPYGSAETAVAKVSSVLNYYPILPINLLVSNNYILSSGPTFYYDDTTGTKTYYPFFVSTITPLGIEDPSNTKFKQSITIKPYSGIINSTFTSNIPDIIFLPVNGLDVTYTATTDIALNNPLELSACYDRYGYIWKWSSFSNCPSSLSGVSTAQPSSWGTVECSGSFPKKWRFEPETLTFLTNVSSAIDPVRVSLKSTTWYLTAYTDQKAWTEPELQILQPQEPRSNYTFTLQISGYGGELDDVRGFTVSRYGNTIISLIAEHNVESFITVTDGLTANDWPVKETIVRHTKVITSIPPYELNIYTPNKFVLVDHPVKIENLFARVVGAVSAVEVILDDVAGETILLTGEKIKQDFIISYTTTGYKNLKITGLTTFGEKITVNYPNLLYVVEKFDTIDTESYFSFDKILIELPWKEQPFIGPNDWVVSDNINACIKMFNDNLYFLNKRNNVYLNTYNEYYGWLGTQPLLISGLTACPLWTWQDTDCTNTDNQYYVTWSELMRGGIIPEVTQTGSLANCGTWEQQTCTLSSIIPSCLGKYCVEWKWSSRKSQNSTELITWKDTKTGGKYQKTWYQPLDECETTTTVRCDEGVWNVNIPGFDVYYDPITVCYSQNRCSYTAIASYDNILFTALNTQLKVLSSDRSATFFDLRTTFNQSTPFVNIKSIALDRDKKLFILDSTLSQVAVYRYDRFASGERWRLFTTFGGVGGSFSKTKFLNPTNIHVDQHDKVWVVDAGNFVLKQYTNTGSWLFTLRDDAYFKNDPPIDVCVDSNDRLHVLTTKTIRVYTYHGEFLFEYYPGEDIIPLTNLKKITTSYNREIIYIANKSKVIRHFKNGNYSGTIIDNKQCVDNINSIYHDEFRNLLVANDDKILKFVDTMTLVPLKAPLPKQYWALNDLLIHDDEYVQNWVYTKVFHRLWDNIEIFRNTLLYNNSGSCKRYNPPIYSKEQITIGQNEIVTSTVINRVLSYLWANFKSVLEYYNTNC